MLAIKSLAPWLLIVVLACVSSIGCLPRVLVKANPTAQETGIRYYRPKPYLKVEPAEVAIAKDQTKIVPGLVRISLVYLPDFSEEYAIDVRPGFGTANVEIKLEDGWNLTEIGQDLDSQTDENLEAIGAILGGIGDVLPTSTSQAATGEHSFTVTARNVPIGFYESIIGRDGRGCKRLYGFRYLGFLPYAICPTDMGGSQMACCNTDESNLYGLTFINGQMVFQSLSEMSSIPPQGPETVASSQSSSAARSLVPATPSDGHSVDLDQLSLQLRTYLSNRFEGVGEVRTESREGTTVVQVFLEPALEFSTTTRAQLRAASAQWLSQNYSSQPLDLQFVETVPAPMPSNPLPTVPGQ